MLKLFHQEHEVLQMAAALAFQFREQPPLFVHQISPQAIKRNNLHSVLAATVDLAFAEEFRSLNQIEV